MELNFREYAEGFWGGAAGALSGIAAGTALGGPLGGVPGAIAGWQLGSHIQDTYRDKKYPQPDAKYFVYYRQPDPENKNGRIVKELLPTNATPYKTLSDNYLRKNNDQSHPYYYYTNNKGDLVKKIKSGYQNYQRRQRYGDYSGGYFQPTRQRYSQYNRYRPSNQNRSRTF